MSREDYKYVSRTFQVTEITVMLQNISGDCRRVTLRARGILSEKQALKRAAEILNTGTHKVTFLISADYLEMSFRMPVEKYIINAEEISRKPLIKEERKWQKSEALNHAARS